MIHRTDVAPRARGKAPVRERKPFRFGRPALPGPIARFLARRARRRHTLRLVGLCEECGIERSIESETLCSNCSLFWQTAP